MVARLREKHGGEGLDVIVGDMAAETTGKTYPLVYLVFNTLYNILTQEGQVECFRNAARHLDENGVFVIEAAPPWAWIRGDQFVNRRANHPGIGGVRCKPVRPSDPGAEREPESPRV